MDKEEGEEGAEKEEREDEYLDFELPDSVLAAYTIQMNVQELDIHSTSVLIFSMAESTEDSNPKTLGKWVSNENEDEEEEDDTNDSNENEDNEEVEDGNTDEDENDDEDDEEKIAQPLDFTIQLTDSAGNIIQFPLSYIFFPTKRDFRNYLENRLY